MHGISRYTVNRGPVNRGFTVVEPGKTGSKSRVHTSAHHGNYCISKVLEIYLIGPYLGGPNCERPFVWAALIWALNDLKMPKNRARGGPCWRESSYMLKYWHDE